MSKFRNGEATDAEALLAVLQAEMRPGGLLIMDHNGFLTDFLQVGGAARFLGSRLWRAR